MKIAVLLSSYNGEKYIKEQINSILSQRGVEVFLIVRDDGSTDKTVDILRSYGEGISFYTGKNIGVRASFFDLIKNAPDADFYAFSDQDDVWLPEKLYRACALLGQTEKPSLCFSNMYTANEDLSEKRPTDIHFKPTFGASMAQNPATGASMVFNRPFMKLLQMTDTPEKISMHDTYAYRLARLVGARAKFDREPSFLYRQHGGNSIGSRTSYFARLKHYASFFLKNKGFSRPAEARLLLHFYRELIPAENLALLKDIISYKDSFWGKLKLLRGGRLSTGSLFTDIVTSLAVLLGRF